jgi:NADPH-dependent curcumin reductase CurA
MQNWPALEPVLALADNPGRRQEEDGVRNRNRQWLLASHPDGMPEEANWRLVEGPVPEPGPGQILARALYLSVDPYMRGRISPARNYAAGVAIGEVMTGGGVGEVVRSNHPGVAPGDVVESFTFGWQDYAVLDGAAARKVDPSLGPVHSALSWLGMPGLTAYFGLLEVGRPRPGDTVVISAASGAVGQIAGQIAKIAGCRAVAVAGAPAKLAWCEEIGYDAGIDHRGGGDLEAAVAEACPDGVDVFFDNTAGAIHDAVMANLAQNARVIVCGTVALADRFERPDIGVRHLRRILITRARIQGFLVFDFAARFDHARARLAAWAKAGRLRHREDIADGLEAMPRAFLRVLEGRNFGKQLVRVAAEG